MMEFQKYMHVERFGNDEVQGIELGQCYVFPKIDGTNGSIWYDGEKLRFGSRNRELSLENDNQGFMTEMSKHEGVRRFCEDHAAGVRLYGEWLVPHAFRGYREDAWRRFYVFDVWDEINEKYMRYEDYHETLEEYKIDYIPPLCIIKNATYENLLTELKSNGFLVQDGAGYGEGIVIKNYEFQNRFGRTVWAKIVSNEFKEKACREHGATHKKFKDMIEQTICDNYVTDHFVDKVYAKIVNENDGWNSRYIPRLLSTVYHDLVTEEIWDVVKKHKNPTINFKTLNTLVILKIKTLKPEIF